MPLPPMNTNADKQPGSDVQTTLFEYDWEWPGLDQFYRETTLMFAKSPDGPFATEDDYREQDGSVSPKASLFLWHVHNVCPAPNSLIS